MSEKQPVEIDDCAGALGLIVVNWKKIMECSANHLFRKGKRTTSDIDTTSTMIKGGIPTGKETIPG